MLFRIIIFSLALVFLFGCVQQNPGSENVPETVKSPLPVCLQLEQKIGYLLERTGSCNTASDCTAGFLGSCEFGCYFAKNRTENVNGVVETVKQFEKQCSTCFMECDTAPAEFSCIQGKCVVVQ